MAVLVLAQVMNGPIHKMFSVMGHISYSNHDWNYFAIEFHCRWYPFGTSLEKFFVMVNLGYGIF